MPQVLLNHKAESNYQLFFLEHDRAKEILDYLAEVCAIVIRNFHDQYRVVSVVKTKNNTTGELMHRLDVSKILQQMLSIAINDNEQNFILYSAFTGIDRVSKYVHNEMESK